MEGKIDPFQGWTPKKHEQHKQKIQSRPDAITLSNLTDIFIKHRTQANEVTNNNYRRHLNMLMDQVGETMPVTMITEEDLRDFCFQDHLANATKRSYLRHMKVFFRWIKEKGYVKHDVTENINKPKKQTKISDKTISESELQAVFKEYRKDIKEKKKKGYITTKSQSRVWFRPVVMTAFYAGLRIKEIVNLKWQDINFKNKQLTVSGTKSGDERTIPIREKLFPVLKAWHRYHGHPNKGLVYASQKKYYENIKMSKLNVSRVFKFYVKATGLKDTINFHGLRHSCGTELMRLGFDINETAKILGHKSLDVTRRYEHLTQMDLSDKMKRLEGDND
ncbi:tyrosine-type recombinase/integrase [Fodinibius roseus]|nr:site-specific integrase [Fodinibius roseus]